MIKNLTMKELPDLERPYEKCLRLGADALSDAELIGVIIRTGSQGEKSTDLAARILTAAPDGILNLMRLSVQDLMKIRGVGQVKAVQLKCAGELAKRISSASRHVAPLLHEPDTVAAYYMERLRHETKERLVLVMFDRKNMFLADKVLSVGSSNASVVSPGEIFRTALEHSAECVILIHNHPSGDPEPSNNDWDVTSRVRECGDLLGIPLIDHIIIGDNRYFSFREREFLTRKGE